MSDPKNGNTVNATPQAADVPVSRRIYQLDVL
jgi:hypothetical protein